MKLYYAPRTRSVRPRWLLEELGVDYTLERVDLEAGEHKKSEYKANVHPLGKVPALVDGEIGMFESGAICRYLADKYLSRGLAPGLDRPERAAYNQWMTFSTATLEPALIKLGSAGDDDKAKAKAREEFDDICDALESAVGDGQWLLGDQFTAADIMIGSPLAWAKRSRMFDERPTLLTYTARVISRPAAVRARLD